MHSFYGLVNLFYLFLGQYYKNDLDDECYFVVLCKPFDWNKVYNRIEFVFLASLFLV